MRFGLFYLTSLKNGIPQKLIQLSDEFLCATYGKIKNETYI